MICNSKKYQTVAQARRAVETVYKGNQLSSNYKTGVNTVSEKVGKAKTRICILEHHYHYNHIISHPVPSHKSLSSSSPLSIMLADELATAAPAGLNIFCPLVLHFNKMFRC